MLLFIFCLLVVLILRTYFYKDPIYLSLPTNSTIFAIEYTAATNSNEFKAIARKSSMPNALFFADLEKYLVPEFESLQIPLAYLNKKLLTFQLFEGEIYPVLVLEFKSKDSMNLLPTFPGFSHSKKGNLLYISTAKKQLESMLSTTPKIYSSPKFRAAYINIPNNNIADLYFNHELLSNKHISGLFGVFENVNQLFSVTVASLRENDYGLFLATYTAPRTGVVFPYTRKKYNAKLPSYLLDNQELFIGGT
jgi:hypothetical protein